MTSINNGFISLNAFTFILVLRMSLFNIIFIIRNKNIFENRLELK
jgi:hypothetical protein